MSIETEKRIPLRKLVIAEELFEPYLERIRVQVPDTDVRIVNQEDLVNEIGDADALVAWSLSTSDLDSAQELKWVQTISAGVENLPLRELSERNIVLTNNSGVCATNIAEHVMAMMLAFCRQLPHLIRGQIAHEWRDQSTRERVFELQGQTCLVVGLGDIGLACAERANAFGMNVVGVRRRDSGSVPSSMSEVVTVDKLEQWLPLSDHVVICLPLTAQSRLLFDDAMLARLSPTAYLYNIGRGQIIDTHALIESLRSGRLAGAGLDVTDPEPLADDSPLWDMENVLVTCHTSGGTPHHWDRAAGILTTNLARFTAGQDLMNVVDLREGY
jgi:phosphoglycerate dehydrogenase-like enzyme